MQTTKEKVAHQSANFFTAALEPFIRKLAVDIGYLPAPEITMSDRDYEGLKSVTGPDGFIRGTRSLGSLQMGKYDALSDVQRNQRIFFSAWRR